MEIRTILTPAEIATLPSGDLLRGATCVVFDVLRATSTILAALANGARSVRPVLEPEEAFAEREARSSGALLGGERGGVRIKGFDLGNSPREYTADAVAGRDLITTTTNGTVALRACAGAETVLAAAFLNLDATADWLRTHRQSSGRVVLVCAGTGADFALEDGVAAGALTARLMKLGDWRCDDATAAMLSLYARHAADLAGALAGSTNGRRLAEIGLGQDVTWCARDSWLDMVAAMEGGTIRPAQNLLNEGSSTVKEPLPPTGNLE